MKWKNGLGTRRFVFVIAAVRLAFCSYDRLEDNGVHMAYCLKNDAEKLAASVNTELAVRFEPVGE